MTIAVLMLLTAPLQNANADLISTSPQNNMEASGSVTWNPVQVSHTHVIHTFHLDHKKTWCFSGTPSISVIQDRADYRLNVKSLKDFTIDITGDLNDGTSGFSITYSDATVQALSSGLNDPVTSTSKGIADLVVTSSIGSKALSDLQNTKPSCVNKRGHGFNPSPPFSVSISLTLTDNVTLEVTQPNAGGPKPRLAQDSGANLLNLSPTTLLFDIPRGAISVTASGTSCQIFDQHGVLRGTCSGGPIGLSSGDFSGLWSMVASGTNARPSVVIDGNPVELLTDVTK